MLFLQLEHGLRISFILLHYAVALISPCFPMIGLVYRFVVLIHKLYMLVKQKYLIEHGF